MSRQIKAKQLAAFVQSPFKISINETFHAAVAAAAVADDRWTVSGDALAQKSSRRKFMLMTSNVCA